MHAALTMSPGATTGPPPVLLLNALDSVVAFTALVTGRPVLEKFLLPPKVVSAAAAVSTSDTASAQDKDKQLPPWMFNPWLGGMELGLWKSLGTTANLYGLSLTTADHGAFLIQLTTLIVPTVQGMLGVPIPQRIQVSIVIALIGVVLFTQDAGGDAATGLADQVQMGDALCVLAAVFYATYDLRLFQWGQRIAPRPLMTGKIIVQAGLSTSLFVAVTGWHEALALVTTDISSWYSPTVLALVVWSGVTVNALVPFLQVGGQQAIRPSRGQTIYASQPLWAAMMSFVWLGETVGTQGLIGGGSFLGAFLGGYSKTARVCRGR